MDGKKMLLVLIFFFQLAGSLRTPPVFSLSPGTLIQLRDNPSHNSTWLLPASGFRYQEFWHILGLCRFQSSPFATGPASSPRPVAVASTTSSGFNSSPAKWFNNSFS